ncbi:hypothetical protein B0186_02995 [Canicola haemoglobinophilus]|uniref:Aminotransferase class IV n=1 Tax=Canicola haemoglobinophilus TaxID=733 RepID=A0A1V4B281_9PAST|nr:aminotransferase class IV family protein [Canicola haemoglobinophilus]OOS01398.1 hypothetical protein B0186_02995 [Canicola haemoglobinophilus]STO59839.1 aminotransferase class IV [Canicola haemoglobinophilus]
MQQFPLFETICVEKGLAKNLSYHQQRYEKTLLKFYPHLKVTTFNLAEILAKHTALYTSEPLIRCRIDYDQQNYAIQCFPYQRKIYRTFQPVFCDHIDYSLKFTDRTLLNQLLEQKAECDEIMIIRQGKVTDCSIGNLIFRQNNQWFTPIEPLLEGTQRAKLLLEKKIIAREILFDDLAQYEEIRLINAMNGL